MFRGVRQGTGRSGSSRIFSEAIGGRERQTFWNVKQQIDQTRNAMKAIALLTVVLAAWAGGVMPSRAQEPAPPPAPAVEGVSNAQLDNWLGPIALYPDPLLAQVLAAATQPSDIVMADRYVSGGGDPGLIDNQPWDPSVKALARYPGVLKMMDDYLDWTTQLGQAFLYQEPDVMDEVQRLRAQALALGNLESTPQENVINEDGAIEILPTEPDVIYVPEYQPDIVYTQHPVGPPCITFGVGFAYGGWMDHDFDWRQHHLLVWDHIFPRPADWWSSRRPSPPAVHGPGHSGRPANPLANPRTRPTHFIVWQVPRVHAVTSGDLAARGWDPHEFHRPHGIEHPAHVNPAGSSLLVLPSHSAGRAVSGPHPSSGIQVYSSATPGHREEGSRWNHASGALIGAGSVHDTERFSHRGHESREEGSRPAHVGHSSGESHAPAPSHTAAPSHPSGGSGKR